MKNALPDMTMDELMALKKQLNELGDELRIRSEYWFEAAGELRMELISRKEGVNKLLKQAERDRKDSREHNYYIKNNLH